MTVNDTTQKQSAFQYSKYVHSFHRQALVRQADEFAGRPEFFAFKLVDYGKNLGMGSWDERWELHRKLANRATRMFIDNKVKGENNLFHSSLLVAGTGGGFRRNIILPVLAKFAMNWAAI